MKKYVAIEYLQAGLLQLVFCLQLNFLNIALLFKVGAKLVPKNYFFTLPKPHWITSSRTSNTKNKCKDPAKSPPTLPLAIRCTCARRYIIWRMRTSPLRLNYPSQDRAALLLHSGGSFTFTGALSTVYTFLLIQLLKSGCAAPPQQVVIITVAGVCSAIFFKTKKNCCVCRTWNFSCLWKSYCGEIRKLKVFESHGKLRCG